MALTQDKFILPEGSPVTGIQTTKSSTLGPSDLWDFGIYDYRDSATSTTPISVTANTSTVITNDGIGADTYKKLPDAGPEDIYDIATNSFDFSNLLVGDMIDIRLDLEITTTANNQDFSIDLELGQSGTVYTIPFIVDQNVKSIGSTSVIRYNGIYMKDSNTIDNSAQFKIISSDALTLEVHGWYCKLMKQGRLI
mgnify:CR=1 FL=1